MKFRASAGEKTEERNCKVENERSYHIAHVPG